MQKNVAGQKWTVFAFDRTTLIPKSGDASNITAKISKDDGALSSLNDTNPTESEAGFYNFDLTQAETNADKILIVPTSVTSNIQVLGVPAEVVTVPSGYSDFSNLDVINSGQANWQTATGFSTLNTGDIDSRLAAFNWDGITIGGISGISFPSNFGDLAITETTGLVSVGTNNDKTGYSISGVKTTLDDLNDINGSGLTVDLNLNQSGVTIGTVNAIAGTIQTLDQLDTEQDSQHTITQNAIATGQLDLDIITGSDGVTLATTQGNYAPAKAGDEMDLVDAPNSTAVSAIQNGLSVLDTSDIDARLAAYNVVATTDLPSNFSDLLINASGYISRVVLVDTTTTNTDMRGTDGANTTTPPSVENIRTELDNNSVQLSGIASDTDTLLGINTEARLSKLDISGTIATSSDFESIVLPSSGLDNIVTFPTNFANLGINSSGHIERVTLVDSNSDYTAPNNSGINQIKAKTDQMVFTNANNLDVTVNYVGGSGVDSPDDFKANTDAASIWEYATRTLTSAANITSDSGVIDDLFTEIKGAGWTSTDTLENIYNATNSLGSGSRSVVIRVNDGSSPIQNAKVRMYLNVENYTSTTDSNGDTQAFGLENDGTWNVVITAPGYQSNVTTLVVSSDIAAGDQVYSLSENIITPPSDPSYCRVGAYIYFNGEPDQNATFRAKLQNRNITTAGIIVNQNESSTTNASGYAYLDLIRQDQIADGNGVYELELLNSKGNMIFRTTSTIPNSGVANLEDLI